MKEKILIIGGMGLFSSRFIEKNSHFDIKSPELSELDITDKDTIQKVITEHNPDWIINFSPLIDIDEAEKQRGNTEGSVWKNNVYGVQNILDSFKSKNIIQISTEKVFPGTIEYPGPYSETDNLPEVDKDLTWYGWAKNRAEKLVTERGGTILRITYPVRAYYPKESDFLRNLLSKIAKQESLSLFDDQQISISFIDEAVETLKKIIETDSHNIFHAGSDTTTPYELFSFLAKVLDIDKSLLIPTHISDYFNKPNSSNRYSAWGGLKTKNTEEELDLHFSTWQTVLELLIGQGLSLPENS